MIEVCFCDSVKGALAMAQHCGNDVIGGAFSIISDKKGPLAFFAKKKAQKEYQKKQLALSEQAVPLGGNREDIVGISFGLSEGDIAAPICPEDCARKEYIRSIFSFDRYHEQEDMQETINTFWRTCMKDLEKLKAHPPQVRIWLDQTPNTWCGLLFTADLLSNSKTEIHIVELPHRIIKENNTIVEYRGWGEIEPQLYGTFLDKERILTEKEISELADMWRLLQSENADLRVVENGFVISADIHYYDDLIRKEFPKDSCSVAQIVGSALGKQKILTGDVFVAKRIEAFIRSGELKIIGNEQDGFYRTVVRCAEKKS